MNILFLTDDVIYVSGVSKHLYYLLKEFSKDEKYNIFLVCPGGDFVDEFKKLGITVIVKKETSHNKRSYLNILKSVWFIYNLVNKKKIQIIHSHTHYSANIAWWTSKLTKSITIQTIHGIIHPWWKTSAFYCRLFHFSKSKYYKLSYFNWERQRENFLC